MFDLSKTMCHFKFLLFSCIILFNVINLISGASIGVESNHQEEEEEVEDQGESEKNSELKSLEDMKVIESEDSPEVSRKDLVKMIQKSQYFQDIFAEQPDPMVIQFGHVCENPNEWEQRFEQRDFKKNHYQGKMRWGNKNGDYGEHYWDLGHAG